MKNRCLISPNVLVCFIQSQSLSCLKGWRIHKQDCKSIKGEDIPIRLAQLRERMNRQEVMWAFLEINSLLLMYFMLHYSYFSSAVSSLLYSSSCQLQGQFHLNGMHKAGDVVLGGIFQIHFFSVFPDMSFTSEPQQPTCHG